MNTETLEQLDHDYEYTNRSREEIEEELTEELEELLDEHRRNEVRKVIKHLESDEFKDLAMNVLDEI